MSLNNLSIILKELRQIDYNSYLCVTFCFRNDLEKIAAILLLHNELKKITDIASEDMIGMVRIAWWKENLEDIFLNNKNKNHHLLEVIYSLKDQIDYDLLQQCFEGFESDFIKDNKMKDQKHLKEYVFRTRTVFFLMILRILNFRDEVLAKKLAANLALISFYFDLLKKIQSEDERVTRFFYDGFFEELKIDAKFWQKNNADKKYDDNLLVIVKYIVQQIENSCLEISEIRKLLPNNLRNLVARKNLVEILIHDLKKKNFDIFSSSLLPQKLITKIKLLIKLTNIIPF